MKITSKGIILFMGVCSILGCTQNESSKVGKEEENLKSDTIAIYLPPIEYDSLVKSISDELSYFGDDRSPFVPDDQDITLKFEYKGKFKEYMRFGTMNVTPWDSTVSIKKISDTSFVFKVMKPSVDGVITMRFEPILNEPYYFSYIRNNKRYIVKPGVVIPLFLRSYITK